MSVSSGSAMLQPLVLQSKAEWVELSFKLPNWPFLNFKKKMRTSTHLFTISLADRLGRQAMLSVTLCAIKCMLEASNGQPVT
jgi:hypothetical protein